MPRIRETIDPSAPGVGLSRRAGEPLRARYAAGPPLTMEAHDGEDELDLNSLPEAGIEDLDLDDSSKFVRFARVPVMDTHGTIFGRDQIKKPISWKTLKLMAQNNNAMIESRGQYPTILIGHTHDDGPGPNDKIRESDQPVHVGFAKNFCLGRYRGEPMLLADFHIRKPLVGMALTYPHRSPELFRSKEPEQNLVDSISLLRRAPERPLGLLTYDRDLPPGVELVRYARDFPPLRPADTAEVFQTGRRVQNERGNRMPMDPEDLSTIIHGVTKGLAAFFKELEHGEHEIEAGEHGMEGELADIEAEEAGGEPLGGEGEEEEEEEEAEREEYAASTPGPTSSFVPGRGQHARYKRIDDFMYADPEHEGDVAEEREIHKPKHQHAAAVMRQGRISGAGAGAGGNYPPVERTRERMARTAANIERVRYERENARLQRRVGDLERYARAAERGADLNALVAAGYDLDVAQELDDCVDLTEPQYERHLTRIAERYRRDPVDQPAIEPAHVEGSTDPDADINGLTSDDSISISRYVRDHPEMDHTVAVNDWIKRNVESRRVGGPRVG
jgi:hypothetical protein